MFHRSILFGVLGLTAAVAVACSGGDGPADEPAPTSTGSGSTAASTVAPDPTASTADAGLSASPEVLAVEPEPDEAVAKTRVTELLDDPPPPRLTRGWRTDFSKHSVPFSEIMSGGPPPDGILPIDSPRFIAVSNPPDYMREFEPVVSLEINGDARADPLAMLMQHEIVNDIVGDIPVTVTYCPLCNTAIVFERIVGGVTLDFGTSGNLRRSDLVMWDRQTQSWWQQITGEAIVGEYTGTSLAMVPAQIVSWMQFTESFPDGQLLSRDLGLSRTYYYDYAPYDGYDQGSGPYFPSPGLIDKRAPAMSRVLTMNMNDEAVAYPFLMLADHPVINDKIGDVEVVIFFAGGTLSSFYGSGGQAALEVGSTAVYKPTVDGRKLIFETRDGKVVDLETGSVWNLFGTATEGSLAGAQLEPIVHANHFWFAWAGFYPNTALREASDLGLAAVTP